MSGRLEFTAENTFDSIAENARQLEKFAGNAGLSPRQAYRLDLIYEELMTNVAKYSYSDHALHPIRVILENDGQTVTFTIIHDGSDFNPWLQQDPDLDVPLEERQEGGIGILLARRFAQSVDYKRAGGKSIITVVI